MSKKLNLTRVKDAMLAMGTEVDTIEVEAPAEQLPGGWASPVDPGAKCHYIQANAEMEFTGLTLCGLTEHRNSINVDECDPLAPEHCKECRTKLLQYRGLI
jgi:hypothetical protein